MNTLLRSATGRYTIRLVGSPKLALLPPCTILNASCECVPSKRIPFSAKLFISPLSCLGIVMVRCFQLVEKCLTPEELLNSTTLKAKKKMLLFLCACKIVCRPCVQVCRSILKPRPSQASTYQNYVTVDNLLRSVLFFTIFYKTRYTIISITCHSCQYLSLYF